MLTLCSRIRKAETLTKAFRTHSKEADSLNRELDTLRLSDSLKEIGLTAKEVKTLTLWTEILRQIPKLMPIGFPPGLSNRGTNR